MDQPLKHPCATTCSGYRQGFEEGRKEGLAQEETRYTALAAENVRLRQGMDATTKELKFIGAELDACLVALRKARVFPAGSKG